MKTSSKESSDAVIEAILETVAYIKKNGIYLEEKLRNDPKFSFVNPNDEFYDFYQDQLNDSGVVTIDNENSRNNDDNDTSRSPKSKEPIEPYPFSFISYDKNITRKDLEIIKVAAAFCVANKDSSYLEKMRLRFDGDSKLKFLDPSHVLNGVFIQFLNQYKQVKRNILGPPMFYPNKNEDFKYTILRRSFQRAEYEEYKKELQDENHRALKLLKVQFAAFDWTHFKVLDKITLPANDETELDIPQPLDFSQLSVKRIDQRPEIHLFKNETDVKEKENGESKRGKRKMKAAGETRLKKRNTSPSTSENVKKQFIECPISHKMIPETKFDKHLQILLGDPHYKSEKEKYEAKHKLTNLTSNEVYENIKKIARNSSTKI